MKFIAYALCADNNAKPSKYIPYGPDERQLEATDPEKVEDLAVNNADENTAYFDDDYLIDNFDEIDAAWQDWKSPLTASAG